MKLASRFFHLFSFTISVLILFLQVEARAGQKLIVEDESVPVYSGPSLKFRQLAELPQKAELTVSPQLSVGPEGEFYRVLVKRPYFSRTRIGYIPVAAGVRLVDDEGKTLESEKELGQNKGVALASRSVQPSLVFFKETLQLWNVAYVSYLTPGAFYRAWLGQLLSVGQSHTTIGGDFGVENFFSDSWSILAQAGPGFVISPGENYAFSGSKKLNFLFQGSFGVRYTVDESASFSLMAVQGSFFTPNSSMLLMGVGAFLEVGL